MNGKGSTPRPLSVTRDEYAARWDAVFAPKRRDLSRVRCARCGTTRDSGADCAHVYKGMKAYWWMGCRISQLTKTEAAAALAGLPVDPNHPSFYARDAIEKRLARIAERGGPDRPDNQRYMCVPRPTT